MRKIFKEFAEFINKGNALALTIGVILGGAFSGIVDAVNQKVVSPLIGAVMGKNYDLSEVLVLPLSYGVDPATGEQIITNAIYFGALIQAIIDFLIIAVVLFLIFKIASNIRYSAKKTAEMIQECFDEEAPKAEPIPEVVPEAPAAPVAPEVAPEILLLTEIRDYLSKMHDSSVPFELKEKTQEEIREKVLADGEKRQHEIVDIEE